MFGFLLKGEMEDEKSLELGGKVGSVMGAMSGREIKIRKAIGRLGEWDLVQKQLNYKSDSY